MNIPVRLIFLSLLFNLSACTAQLEDYRHTSPNIALEDFFNGHLNAYGIVQDRSGKVKQRFTAKLFGKWENNKGVLEEDL